MKCDNNLHEYTVHTRELGSYNGYGSEYRLQRTWKGM